MRLERLRTGDKQGAAKGKPGSLVGKKYLDAALWTVSIQIQMNLFFAYVGPGVGLLAWQAIVAAALGALFYLRKTRAFLINSFRKLTGRAKTPEVAVSKPRIHGQRDKQPSVSLPGKSSAVRPL